MVETLHEKHRIRTQEKHPKKAYIAWAYVYALIYPSLYPEKNISRRCRASHKKPRRRIVVYGHAAIIPPGQYCDLLFPALFAADSITT